MIRVRLVEEELLDEVSKNRHTGNNSFKNSQYVLHTNKKLKNSNNAKSSIKQSTTASQKVQNSQQVQNNQQQTSNQGTQNNNQFVNTSTAGSADNHDEIKPEHSSQEITKLNQDADADNPKAYVYVQAFNSAIAKKDKKSAANVVRNALFKTMNGKIFDTSIKESLLNEWKFIAPRKVLNNYKDLEICLKGPGGALDNLSDYVMIAFGNKMGWSNLFDSTNEFVKTFRNDKDAWNDVIASDHNFLQAYNSYASDAVQTRNSKDSNTRKLKADKIGKFNNYINTALEFVDKKDRDAFKKLIDNSFDNIKWNL